MSNSEQIPASPAQQWFDDNEADWKRHQAGIWPEPVCFDPRVTPFIPEWYRREREYQYRKGFYHGIAEAAELVSDLYRRGGYLRGTEIANMLGDWCNDLRKWKSQSLAEPSLQEHGHPKLKWTPWPDIKKQVHERDEHLCSDCDSTVDLEVHHVEPVCEGGLPTLDNLILLCAVCHKLKKKKD